MRSMQSPLAVSTLVMSICAAISSSAAAPAAQPVQAADPAMLTLDRIFSSREFSTERPLPPEWLEDDSGYLLAEPASPTSQEGAGHSIVLYDARTGQRRVVVPAERLVPAGQARPLRFADYKWSLAHATAVFCSPRTDGADAEAAGDCWVLQTGTWRLHKLGGPGSPRLSGAALSPRGGTVAYVKGHDVFVEELSSGRILRLTHDGSSRRVNGTGAGVYLGQNTSGFRWSPDGTRIAFVQFDTEGVKDFSIINNTDSLYPAVKDIEHVKPGETLPAARVGILPAAGGETLWVGLPGDPRNHYIRHLDWTPNPNELVVVQLNRRQNTARVFLADATTGQARSVLEDKDDAWVEPHPVRWLDGGRHFTWVSERDGWRHIYRASRDGTKTELVTPGTFDVINVQGIDEPGGWLYFIASPDNATQRYLHRARLDGSGKTERVTPPGRDGTHVYDISPGGRWAYHTFSTFDTPPVTELIALPSHQTLRTLVDNAALKAKLAKLKCRPTEFVRVDIGDGTELDAWVMKPHDFDANGRYPVLFYVYGMPGGQTVLDRWGESREANRYLWQLMLTQRGYLVMSVDNRGTPAPRGRAWRKIIYLKHGVVPSHEQAAAVRAITKRWSYVDPARIGVYGWSGGGCMSLNLILRYPDLYNTAMAGAGLSDHRFYHAGFTERFMGLPQDHPEAYNEAAPLRYAKNLKGNLLIIHGTGDSNVHYQSTEAMVNALIAEKKRFTVMPYPNRSHAATEGENTQYHLHDLYTSYLEQHLGR